jgi:NADPH:quinone reductase-like Zn-dependent oxidoreductase
MLALIRDGRHDPPVTLRDVAGPEPARDEAAVQVVASSLNPSRGSTSRTTRSAVRPASPSVAASSNDTGTSIERAVRAIRPDGTIVFSGATDRQPANLTLLDFIGHEGARILTYFSYASGDETSAGGDLATLDDMVARRRLRPTIGAVIDWHQADEALAALRSNQIAGKAVLSIDGSDMRWKGVAPMNMFVTGGSGVLGRAVGDAAMSLGGGGRLTW